MGIQTLGRALTHREEHGGPIHRVGRQDVLSDQVIAGRPPLMKGVARPIVRLRIDLREDSMVLEWNGEPLVWEPDENFVVKIKATIIRGTTIADFFYN